MTKDKQYIKELKSALKGNPNKDNIVKAVKQNQLTDREVAKLIDEGDPNR